MYAGGKNLRIVLESEKEPAYHSLFAATERFVADFDGDSQRKLSLLDIYIPSSEEIEAAEKNGDGVNYSLIRENDELFRQNVLFGDYYICLLSEDLFKKWTETESGNPFREITEYLPEGAKIKDTDDGEGYRLISKYGVYLSSTPISDNPGYSSLPSDTVICIRKYTNSSSFSGKTAERYYSHAENTLRLMLLDKAYS